VGLTDRVVQAGGRLRNVHDEDEVEEQLQGRRRAVGFVSGARPHRGAKGGAGRSLLVTGHIRLSHGLDPNPNDRRNGL
jgi:hypothetical protein